MKEMTSPSPSTHDTSVALVPGTYSYLGHQNETQDLGLSYGQKGARIAEML
jgi:hypothetical protein